MYMYRKFIIYLHDVIKYVQTFARLLILDFVLYRQSLVSYSVDFIN